MAVNPKARERRNIAEESSASQPRRLLIALILAGLTLLPYLQVYQHEFVNYDDPEYVTENRMVQGGLSWEGVRWAFTGFHAGNWHPLTWLSHMLDVELFGMNPPGHHMSSVALHLLNTVLLFIVLERMSGALWRSALVAALFGLHPLHVESVAWVAERKDVLSTAFGLLALWAYHGYVRRPAAARYALVAGLFALSLMAKPMLVTLPFLMLLLDFWPLKRLNIVMGKGQRFPGFKVLDGSKLVFEKIPLLVLSLASCWITFLAQEAGGAVSSLESRPLTSRLGNAVSAYGLYILKTVLPFDLAVFYPLQNYQPPWVVIVSAVFLLLVTFVALSAPARRPYLAVGWLWFLGTMVPVIGLVQVGLQSMADRYTYWPLIGLFIATAWLAADVLTGERIRNVKFSWSAAVGLSAAVISFYLLQTFNQVSHWRNSRSLLTHCVSATTNNFVCHNNLGVFEFEAGRKEQALQHYLLALRFNPSYAKAHNNLGRVYESMGEMQKAREHYQASLKLLPKNPMAYLNMGNTMAKEGRYEDAVQSYLKAITVKPDYFLAHFNLGQTLEAMNRTSDAMLSFRKAEELKPNDPEVKLRIGILYAKQKDLKNAIGFFQQALAANPNLASAHFNLGLAFEMANQTEKAMEHYRSATRILPEHALAHYNLGLLLAEKGDLADALKRFERAVELQPGFADAHNNMGIILTMQGRTEEALRSFSKALTAQPNHRGAQENYARLKEQGAAD